MKIIGHVGSAACIVEMSRREVAQIAGRYYAADLKRCYGDDGFRVGTEYDFSAIYQRLRAQEKAADRLNTCAETLRALADIVEQQKPIQATLNGEGGAS